MKKRSLAICIGCAGLMLSAAGCDGISVIESSLEQIQDTPTPAITATPTPAPTAEPTVTPTPGPRVIGTKTDDALSVDVTNNCRTKIREILLSVSGSGSWSRNMLPSESLLHEAEEVQMYYSPLSADTSVYDLQITTAGGSVYMVSGVNFDQLSAVGLNIDSDDNFSITCTMTDGSVSSVAGTQTEWGNDEFSDEENSDLTESAGETETDAESDSSSEINGTPTYNYSEDFDIYSSSSDTYYVAPDGSTYTFAEYFGLDE